MLIPYFVCPMFVFQVEGMGGQNSEEMKKFRSHCYSAFLIIRKHVRRCMTHHAWLGRSLLLLILVCVLARVRYSLPPMMWLCLLIVNCLLRCFAMPLPPCSSFFTTLRDQLWIGCLPSGTFPPLTCPAAPARPRFLNILFAIFRPSLFSTCFRSWWTRACTTSRSTRTRWC